MRHLPTMMALMTLAAGSPTVAADRCKDEQGRLMKCPKPAGGAIRCRDDRGRKAKCGLPGTHPVDG